MRGSKNFCYTGRLKRVNARFGVALVFLVMLLGAGCRPSAPQRQQRTAPSPVRVVEVERQPIRQTVRYVGTVRVERQVRVAARLPGTLEELSAERGDWVEKDQVIARIDAPDLQARRGQVRAELRRARTDRDYLCKRYDTDQRLAKQQVLEAAKLDASKKMCASAREGVRAVEAKLREVEATLQETVERAPVSGPVLDRLSEPGEQVGPGKPLLVLGTDRREVVVPVAEADRSRGVGVGTRALVTLPDGTTLEVPVDDTGPTAKGPARAAETTLLLDAKHKQILPGSSVDVEFILHELESATPVPLEALRQTSEGARVYVVQDGKATAVEVEPTISSGGMVAVEPELDAGAHVAVTNVDTLQDGEAVYAVEAGGGER